MKLCNNPNRRGERKWKRGQYYLFDYHNRTLLKQFSSFNQILDYFKPLYMTWQLRKFLRIKLIFEGLILCYYPDPVYDEYTVYTPKFKERRNTYMNFNAFIQEQTLLDRIDRGLPFFDSVTGLNKHWKPEYVLTQQEAKNQLKQCFPQSKFYISEKHVIYLKYKDLYYKLNMID